VSKGGLGRDRALSTMLTRKINQIRTREKASSGAGRWAEEGVRERGKAGRDRSLRGDPD